jgi:hypothetical protein
MGKRAKAPSNIDISDAIGKAKSGNGRPLAAMVKAFSAKDLARGFSRAGTHSFAHYDPWWSLEIALVFAAGMKSSREELRVEMRALQKKFRDEDKAAEKHHG